jgi:mono/diheme cytochrome c family protein
MKKLFKIVGIIVLSVIVVVIGGLIYFNSSYPKVDPPTDITVEATNARIVRGEYLVKHVTMCLDCHSSRDWTKLTGPIIAGTEGKGGHTFDEEMGFPGKITPKNITPAALGTWSEGEIIRAITCGVNKDNEVIFPMMPFNDYNQLSEEDLYSIVAYIKTLKPIEHKTPERELNFPLNLLVKTMAIEHYTPKEAPNKSDTINYGKYLVTIASCQGCHTPTKEGKALPGMEFAGGEEFNLPWGIVRTANITPDIETGIGNLSKEDFIKKFKFYELETSKNIPVKENEFNTIMPWTLYAGMSEEDLSAIYDYLRTVKPVKHRVEKWTPPQANITQKN